MSSNRLVVLAGSIALYSIANSCCSCPTTPPDLEVACGAIGTAGGPLQPKAKGIAYFVDESVPAQARKIAKLRIGVSFDYGEPMTSLKSVSKVHIFGAPGEPSASELAHCANLIYTVPSPTLPPAYGMTPWVEGHWDGSSTKYRLLVRFLYEKTSGAGVEPFYADRLLELQSPFAATKAIQMSVETGTTSPTDDNTASLQCSATFNGAQHLSLFNLDLTYNPQPDRVDVYAWSSTLGTTLPTPNSAYLVYSEPNPPAGGWHPTQLSGSYDGTSDKYFMTVKTVFPSGTPGVATTRGYFDGILAQQGVPIDIE
jgi:hypothetical protein